MIDASAQVLMNIKSGNAANSDKLSAPKPGSSNTGASFNEHYDRSRMESTKKPEENVPKNNQSQVSDRSRADKNLKQARNEGPRNNKNETSDNVEKKSRNTESTTVSKQVKKEETTEATQTKNENVNLGVVEENLEQEIETELSAVAALITEETLDAEAEEVKVDDTAELLLAEKNKGLKVGHEIKELIAENDLPKHKLGEIAQSIVNEFKASIEKTEKADKPVALTRAQVLAEIEKVLDTEKLKESGIPAQLLKPEPTANLTAAKIIGEQFKAKDLNLNTQIDLEPELVVESESLDLPESSDSTDALLEKILARLDLSKVKAETQQPKIVADKTSIAEFVDQITTKVSNESGGPSLFSQVAGINSRGSIMPAAQQFTMTTHINQPEWGTDFSKRIQFMINNDIKHAELRLDPPELGRINIKISMNQDQATVAFTSAHSNVRESIENTLPRLRELLADSGIQLGDANINQGQEKDANQTGSESTLSGPVFPGLDEETSDADMPTQVIQHSIDGVIDYFA